MPSLACQGDDTLLGRQALLHVAQDQRELMPVVSQVVRQSRFGLKTAAIACDRVEPTGYPEALPDARRRELFHAAGKP